MHDTIIILDFGSQTTQLIAKRIREHNIYAVLLPYDTDITTIRSYSPKGVILSGGPLSVFAQDAPMPDVSIFQLGVPILGICYGLQLISRYFGGEVCKSKKREYGETKMRIKKKKNTRLVSRLFKDVSSQSFVAWMSHQDCLQKMPIGFDVICYSDISPYAGIQNNHIFGIQFHPEVSHCEFGLQIIYNFVSDICGCSPTWKPEVVIESIINKIRNEVGKRQVLHAVSGGVDSTVLAFLLKKALKSNVRNIFVNTGLMRKNEPEQIMSSFQKIDLSVELIDAKLRFLSVLKGKTDPEEKRIVVGNTFLDIFFEKLGSHDLLSQGTLYPDVIESMSVRGASDKIKSHHNLVPRTQFLRKQGRILEPLKDLFKDDVRNIGKSFGVPDFILLRHPSPGPDGAIRIIGEVTEERLSLRNEADAIFVEEICNAGLYNKISQAFVALSNDKAVGVMGDLRTYGYIVFLRAVVTDNFMTADWYKMPDDVLQKVSSRIINEVSGITRVLYDITQKPPGTICYM